MLPAMLLMVFDSPDPWSKSNVFSRIEPGAVYCLLLFSPSAPLRCFLFSPSLPGAVRGFAEREAYYKAEMLKKIADAGGGNNNPARSNICASRGSVSPRPSGWAVLKLGGLVVTGLGLGSNT